MRIPALICALAFLFSAPMRAAEETWVKVQTPHFLVLSNGSLKDAREVATDFEQIHAVFAQALPTLRTDSSAETIVLAVKDEKTFVEMLPREKKLAPHIGGQFLKGWEKDYVLVRLDLRTQGREVVYHEYIHKLLHLNFTRLPVWLARCREIRPSPGPAPRAISQCHTRTPPARRRPPECNSRWPFR